MPELPDVEVFKQYLDATSLHQRIEKTQILSGDILRDVSPQFLQRRLKRHAFGSTRCHGKNLFVSIEGNGHLVLHFGMTGGLDYAREGGGPSEHARVLFHFEGGARLAYLSVRKIGFVSYADEPEAFLRAHDIGPDALALGFGDLQDLLGERRGTIKSALMDQGLLAGIGNVYADEILFQAGIPPRATPRDLGRKALRRLHRQVGRVLRKAAERHADPERLPRTWLLPRRGKEGAACPRCGGKLRRTKVSGRTTCYCPRCQKGYPDRRASPQRGAITARQGRASGTS